MSSAFILLTQDEALPPKTPETKGARTMCIICSKSTMDVQERWSLVKSFCNPCLEIQSPHISLMLLYFIFSMW